MISRQLELGFENRPGLRRRHRPRSRSYRAHWWFENMRGVVDTARDWPAADEVKRASSGTRAGAEESGGLLQSQSGGLHAGES